MMRVVLDANVFVSAALKPNSKQARIIDLVKAGRVILLLSQDILDELRKVFRYPKIRKELLISVREIDEALSEIARVAILTPGKMKIRAIQADPADNRYLECALEGQADFIISGDRHLTDVDGYQGLKIVDPATFLVFMTESGEP